MEQGKVDCMVHPKGLSLQEGHFWGPVDGRLS